MIKKERLKQLEKQKAELLCHSKSYQVKNKVPAPALTRTSIPTVQPPEAAGQVQNRALHEKALNLAAKQQQKSVRNLQKGDDGLTIAGIRALPGMTPAVEQFLTGLQATAPSLARTPNATSSTGVSFQPPGVFNALPEQANSGEELETDFVYLASTGKLVQVIRDTPISGGSGQLQSPVSQLQNNRVISHKLRTDGTQDDEYASEDEDCPVKPGVGKKFVWYRYKQRRKYFVEKSTTEMIKTYEFDKATDRWYEKFVPNGTDVHQGCRPKHPSRMSTTYVDHRASQQSPIPQMHRGVRSPAVPAPPSIEERFPAFVRGEPEKQGRDSKVPELVQWARNCPVNWTTKVTLDTNNPVLWAWAYVAEILATRTGQAPNLEQGELEARLQHFCNVLEITLQSSSQSDFCGEAWNVGRLYHQKVQQKVDTNQFSWQQISVMNHGASLPHELMAAHQELTRKPKRDPPKQVDGGGSNGGGSKTDRKKLRCLTWNRSEVRGKCQYEIENAPGKCNRVHECTYCKSKSHTPVNHQRSFCPKRLEEEG